MNKWHASKMPDARGRRSSVNQKIEKLLESSVREQLEASSQSLSGAHADRILARRRLYGIGTGGELPAVRRWDRGSNSAMMKSQEERRSPPNSPPNYLSSSQSLASISTLGTQFPFFSGAESFAQDSNSMASSKKRKKNGYGHEGMYSIITHKTDPEKVFYNSFPSATGPVNFPPWYVGYQNSTTKPMDIPSVRWVELRWVERACGSNASVRGRDGGMMIKLNFSTETMMLDRQTVYVSRANDTITNCYHYK